MSNYTHGISTNRKPTALASPVITKANIQVIIGTAPVNMCEDPYSAVNVPIAVYSMQDAIKKVGYSKNFDKFTICQSLFASFNVFAVAPIVLINVLDPNNHIKAVTALPYDVNNYKAKIPVEGILLDTLEVTNLSGSTTYELITDYVATFDDDGSVIISITKTGAASNETQINVAYTQLDPEQVTAEDIIGGYNVSDRIKKGLEVIGDIYPKLGLVPGTLIAPGFSHIPVVNTAMTAKTELIYSLFSAKCISDIDSSDGNADSIDKVREWKNSNGYSDRRMLASWPKVKVGEYSYYFSAQLAALLQYMAAINQGIPSNSPDNNLLKITGLVLENGEEVIFDMSEANDYCNACGVITAININGWLCWGNNTSIYPLSTDVIDRWITSVMMFDYIENNFKLSFFSKVSNKANYREIENIVNSENMTLNGLQGSGDIAGGEISFSMDDNPINQILGGRIKFRERIATYPPMESIENEFEFDPTILQSALEGGDN